MSERRAKTILFQIWNTINETVFGGLLLEPRFALKRLRKDWGQFRASDRPTMVVARQFFENDPEYSLAELIATVSHESIHQLQHQKQLPMRHDRYFGEWAKKLGYR